MSEIDNGIRQPLKFYDAVSKQHWRQKWVNNGGLTSRHFLLNPQNSILPFQIRRRKSAAAITTFDLYTYDNATDDFFWDMDLFSIIPAPSTSHLRVIQMQNVDNIVWYPLANFRENLSCGLHYVVLSDGTNYWYSEVFGVIDAWTDTTVGYMWAFYDRTVVGTNYISKDGTDAGAIIHSNKPF